MLEPLFDEGVLIARDLYCSGIVILGHWENFSHKRFYFKAI